MKYGSAGVGRSLRGAQSVFTVWGSTPVRTRVPEHPEQETHPASSSERRHLTQTWLSVPGTAFTRAIQLRHGYMINIIRI